MHPLAASLERSPELFPHSVNVETHIVILVRLTDADYQAASFLDDRVLTRQTIGRQISIPELEAAVSDTRLEERCDFIFHIGHVGSTLLSRLLGSHPGIFALREPTVLRTFAQVRAEARVQDAGKFEHPLSCFLRLLSRTFRPEQRANIKATSFVSELAAEILSRPSAPRAVLLFVPAETYLATIFGGPNSRQEARVLAESRLNRLHRRVGEARWRLDGLSEGEMIAMSWACEMSALTAAADAAGDRALWLNFESFLDEPAASLTMIFRHFGIELTEAEIISILSGPEMQRYSKAPEYAYDANLRDEVLDHARRDHAAEIARGLAWLNHARTTVSSITGTDVVG